MMTHDLSNAAPHMAIPVGGYIQDELKDQEDRNKADKGDYEAKRKNLLIAIQQFIEVCKASGHDVPDELMNLQ